MTGRLTKNFLYFFFNRPEVKTRIASTATGSKVKHTSPGKILDVVIALPPISEQKLISQALEAADSKRRMHERTRNELSDLFRTLLHQLMTAQIRVHDVDLSALEAAGQSLEQRNGRPSRLNKRIREGGPSAAQTPPRRQRGRKA